MQFRLLFGDYVGFSHSQIMDYYFTDIFKICHVSPNDSHFIFLEYCNQNGHALPFQDSIIFVSKMSFQESVCNRNLSIYVCDSRLEPK